MTQAQYSHRYGGTFVFLEHIPQSLPHLYKVWISQMNTSIPKRLQGSSKDGLKIFKSKTVALSYAKEICKKFERTHSYEPNSHWNVSLFIEGLGNDYDGAFMCVNQKFVEYKHMR